MSSVPRGRGLGDTRREGHVRSRYAAPIALGLAAVFGLAGCGSGGTNTATSAGSMPFDASVTPSPTSSPTSSPPGSISTPAATPTDLPTPAPAPSSPSAPATPSLTATPAPPAHVGLQTGDKGPKVLALQQKLQAMGFWLSAADGSYGQTTEQAVLAFQKAAGLG